MTDSADMQLVFRLAGVGFALPIDDLVEIREAGNFGEAGDAPERLDLAAGLGLEAPVSGGALLVLCGEAGPWMTAVERIEGIFPAGDLRYLSMPPLLQRDVTLPFEVLALWRQEPLHVCRALQLERFGRRT